MDSPTTWTKEQSLLFNNTLVTLYITIKVRGSFNKYYKHLLRLGSLLLENYLKPIRLAYKKGERLGLPSRPLFTCTSGKIRSRSWIKTNPNKFI